MKVRKLSPTRDFIFGQSAANYFVNDPLGVAQVVETSLQLFTGDFFLDTTAGPAWRTAVLGKYTGSTRDLTIRTKVLSVPGVLAITSYSSSLNGDTREFDVSAAISTIYGPAAITIPSGTPPAPLANTDLVAANGVAIQASTGDVITTQ